MVLIGMAMRTYIFAKSSYITLSLFFDSSIMARYTVVGAPLYSPFWFPTLLYESCVLVVIVVGLFLAFILMFQKKFTYPFVMIGLIAGMFVYHVLDHILASQITTMRHDSRAFVLLMVSLTINAAIWIPYFLMSERVKQTFRR